MNQIADLRGGLMTKPASVARIFHNALSEVAGCAIVDLQGKVLFASDRLCKQSGFSASEIVGNPCHWLMGDEKFLEARSKINSAIEHHGVWRKVCKNLKKNGTAFWVDCHVVDWKNDSNGELIGYLVTQIDITDSVSRQNTLKKKNDAIISALEQFPGGLLIYDQDHKLIYCNQKHKELLELPNELFENGTPTLEAITRSNALRGEYGEGDPEEQVQARLDKAKLAEPHVYERVRPNGTVLEVRGAPLCDGGFVSTHVDITEKKNAQSLIAHMAHHDSLTGLANRTKLQNCLISVKSMRQKDRTVAVHHLDLDRFKAVNDTKGHVVGDALLHAVADRIRNSVLPTDIVARIGGDEFAIIQPDLSGPAEARALAKTLIAELSKPFKIEEHNLKVGTSIGIALAATNDFDGDELLYNANVALTRAKSERRGTFRFYEKDMDIEMRQRSELEVDLHRALELNELQVVYQPIMSLEEDRPTSYEALLRWNHSKKGPIRTDVLISAAEESGLIAPIGEWALRKACEEAATWPEDISIAVNVSVIQFRSGKFADSVFQVLSETGVEPSRLILEITESLLIKDNDNVEMTLNKMKAAGIRIALDDFGTGFSSLSYLNSIAFDKLKIDRSFVCEVKDYNKSRSIFRAIASLGSSLQITTVAEGVEGPSQLETSISEGVKEFQGYLFSRPILPEEVPKTFNLKVSQFRKSELPVPGKTERNSS